MAVAVIPDLVAFVDYASAAVRIGVDGVTGDEPCRRDLVLASTSRAASRAPTGPNSPLAIRLAERVPRGPVHNEMASKSKLRQTDTYPFMSGSYQRSPAPALAAFLVFSRGRLLSVQELRLQGGIGMQFGTFAWIDADDRPSISCTTITSISPHWPTSSATSLTR